MSRRGIVLAGTVILDIVNIIDRWPPEETVALIARTEQGAGGPPHNAAAGLAKLGADFPVTLIGAVGADAYGETLIAQAKGYGIADARIRRVDGAVTSHTHVMTSAATGRRTFFHQPGVSARLEPSWLLPENDDAKFFYLGSPGIAAAMDAGDGWRSVLESARARGFVTCLELVPIGAETLRKHVPPLLPLTDVFIANDHEVQAITGVTLDHGGRFDWPAAREACERLFDMGVAETAAVHHAEGAVAMTRGGEFRAAGAVMVPQSEIAGTVGAGDAFYAGFLLGLHDGWPLQECLALANAAAATSLHSPTTSAGIRPWRECLDYARERGIREASPQ